jgi:hypothetical protein
MLVTGAPSTISGEGRGQERLHKAPLCLLTEDEEEPGAVAATRALVHSMKEEAPSSEQAERLRLQALPASDRVPDGPERAK